MISGNWGNVINRFAIHLLFEKIYAHVGDNVFPRTFIVSEAESAPSLHAGLKHRKKIISKTALS